MADQAADRLRDLLGSQVYASAFDAVMSGRPLALLPEDQREALALAQELAAVSGPGYPVPLSIDPNRPEATHG